MAQLVVWNLDEELVAKLKLRRPSTADLPKRIAKFSTKRSPRSPESL
jgi:hypothetical protein